MLKHETKQLYVCAPKGAVRSVSICVRERPRTFGNLAITARQLPNVRGRSRTNQLTELTAGFCVLSTDPLMRMA